MGSKKVPLHLRGQGPGQGVWSTSVCQVPPGQGVPWARYRVSGSLCCVGLSQPPRLPRPGKGHRASPGEQVHLQVKAGHVSSRCQHRLCGCQLCSKPLAERAVPDLPAEGPPRQLPVVFQPPVLPWLVTPPLLAMPCSGPRLGQTATGEVGGGTGR